MPQFVFILLLLAALWLLLIRPAQRRQKLAQRQQQALLESLVPGTEIVTAGGLYGTVVDVSVGDEVRIEISPGTEVRIARRAIAAVVSDDEEGGGDEPHELEDTDEPEAKAEANLRG